MAAARHLAWIVAVLVAKPLEKVALDGELAYGLQQLVVLLLGGFLLPLSLELLPCLAEDVLGPLFQQLVSPLRRDRWLDVVLRGHLGQCLVAPYDLEGDPHLELGRVPPSRRLAHAESPFRASLHIVGLSQGQVQTCLETGSHIRSPPLPLEIRYPCPKEGSEQIFSGV